MPGEFYIEDKKLKSDLTEIKNTVTNIQNNVTQIQNDVTTIVTLSGGGVVCADFWSETIDGAEVELDAAPVLAKLKALAEPFPEKTRLARGNDVAFKLTRAQP